jgi:hypothetical protein
MVEVTPNESGFGKNANAIIFSKLAFDHLFYEYNIWYKRLRKNGWLPVEWPDQLEGLIGKVQAKFESVKVTSLVGPNRIRLRYTLKSGTFTCKGTEIPIDNWSFYTEGEVGFEETNQSSEDEFPYYKKAFNKIGEKYRIKRQFYINLRSQLLTGQIDYNTSKLTEDQKTAFNTDVQLLISNYIAKHEKFVLLYLGTNVIPGSLSSKEVFFFFPEKMFFQIFTNDKSSEVRFPYCGRFLLSNWHGETNIPLVPTENEGCFMLGRESFFPNLTDRLTGFEFNKKHKPAYKDYKIDSIVIADDSNLSKSFKITLINETTLLINCTYNIKRSFQLPDLTIPEKFYTNSICYDATRKYEISLSLNYENNGVETKAIDQSDRSKDKMYWENDVGKTPMSPTENPELYNSVVNGSLTEGAAKSIAMLCIGARISCDTIMNAYQNGMKVGQSAYNEVMKEVSELNSKFRTPVANDYSFMELPESELISFEKIHYDNEWNVCLNIKRKSTPVKK